MVRILSNGDIVPDDDPRAQAAGSRGNSAGDNSNRPRQVCCKYITICGCDVTVTLSRSSARDRTLETILSLYQLISKRSIES